MAAPTGGPKGLPAGVGTWLSAEIAEGGDAGFEGTCNVDWQFQCGVEMRPAALFEVQVYDQNDNGAEAETHVDGFLEKAWNALTAFLKAMWEAIKELASALVDWIWDALNALFNPLIEKVEELKDDFTKKVEDIFTNSDESMQSQEGRFTAPPIGFGVDGFLTDFYELVFKHGFPMLIFALSLALTAAMVIVLAILKILSGGFGDSFVGFLIKIIKDAFMEGVKNVGEQSSLLAVTIGAEILIGVFFDQYLQHVDETTLNTHFQEDFQLAGDLHWPVLEFISGLFIIGIQKLQGSKIGGGDFGGLFLGLIGWVLESALKFISKLFASLVSLIFAFIGFMATLPSDTLDKSGLALMPFFEESISFGALFFVGMDFSEAVG